jgi:two-component system sensor histidine kinase QseC
VLRGTLWPLALALPLLALLIWWAVRQGTAPLRALGQALAARDAQALGPVTLPDVPAEMAPMLHALNQLFGRITTMVAAERRFTADAAHELRTPIAAIRAQAQVALAERDDAHRAHALRATLAGCDRATHLVEQLLMLSRLEAGDTAPNGASNGPPASPVDLGALAQRVAAEMAPRAIERRQTLGLDAAPGCTVAGQPTLLAVLLRNLIDNALRYSPDGTEVRLALSVAGGQVRLQVDDSGPGLADADLQRLGERFFRVLGSGQEGSGLGWSIVRRIAAAQGAVVEVARSATLGGLAVAVRWPLAAVDPAR